jgi:hypothetical protein
MRGQIPNSFQRHALEHLPGAVMTGNWVNWRGQAVMSWAEVDRLAKDATLAGKGGHTHE